MYLFFCECHPKYVKTHHYVEIRIFHKQSIRVNIFQPHENAPWTIIGIVHVFLLTSIKEYRTGCKCYKKKFVCVNLEPTTKLRDFVFILFSILRPIHFVYKVTNTHRICAWKWECFIFQLFVSLKPTVCLKMIHLVTKIVIKSFLRAECTQQTQLLLSLNWHC